MVLGCATLTLIGVWLNISGRSDILHETDPRLQTVFYGCRFASLLLMALAYRPVYRNAQGISILCGCLIVAGTVVRVVALQSGETPAHFFEMVLGNALCGLGYLPCNLMVYIALARALSLRQALLVVLAALLCKQQLPALALGLPPETHLWVLLGILSLLMASLVGFWNSEGAPGLHPARMATPSTGDARRYVVALGGISGFSLFVFGAVSGIGLAGGDGSSATHGAIMVPLGKLAALGVFVALSYLLVLRRIDRPLVGRFIPAFITLALSTALATTVNVLDIPTVTGIASAYFLGVYDFNQFLSWTLVVCACQQKSPVVVRSAVAIVVVYDGLATFAGPLAREAFAAYGPSLVSICGLVMAVLATAVFPFAMTRAAAKRSFDQSGSLFDLYFEAEIDELEHRTRFELATAMEQRCRYIAQDHGLTTRESEVLCLLCQGRSRLSVGEELAMAEGTVKTHIAHIYEKLKVGTREELMALAFAGSTANTEQTE